MRSFISPPPVVISVGLKSFNECVHGYSNHILAIIENQFIISIMTDALGGNINLLAHTLCGSFSKFHPSGWSEIRWFSHIEAMIESRVITIRKSYHYFAWLLDYFIEWNIMLFQPVRTDERHFMAKVSFASFITFGKKSVCQFFQSMASLWWNRIPSFRCTVMQIVYWI